MNKSALAPLIIFVLAGFSGTDNFPAQEYRTLTVADWPLKFVQHDFDAFCYSTYRCAVRYNGFTFADDPDDKLQISSASLGSGYPDNLKASYLGVPNFPMPADVSWRSADGTAHHAEVDIAHIFAGGLIKHNAKREDIAEGVSITNPEIILEVNDRTINVYMRAHIPMKTLQIPGNRYSDYRADLVLAWSRTY
ncbi:hypothetical protein [Methylobacterium brachiatum]|uniref:hypothetical protein n=1 Tax=Methylobacterium brachiatum TaxID=269660 RepID=UPI0008E09517|nr:hypothetical protein [Methylobacterium brachiatum]SFI77093.1 hypothetical protein SAMN02799642_02713 [Methylobacterium brachiatum]